MVSHYYQIKGGLAMAKQNRKQVTTKQRNVYRGKQGSKDSSKKRVNFDNTRVSKFDKDIRQLEKKTQKNTAPESVRDMDKPGCNDISWYTHNPEMLKASGTLQFASILGDSLGSISAYDGLSSFTVPGILKVEYSPMLGGVSSPNALNQAATSTYSYLVHANSRNYNYDPADLMIMILAGAQVFSAMSHVIRAYGIAKTYEAETMYTPDAHLLAMGFDPNDFRSNLSNIWFDINELIARTTQIWIPNTFPLISRWFWLNANIYFDANSRTSQCYEFIPHHFLQYESTLLSTGGCLRQSASTSSSGARTPFDTTQANTWATWLSMLNNMIDALLTDSDRGMIYGDILNAYGKDKLYALSPIPADYRISPVYNAEVLTQIENLMTGYFAPASVPLTETGMTGVAQDSNGLLQPVFGASTGAWSSNQYVNIDSSGVYAPSSILINFHQAEQPSPEQIMIATRLTSAGAIKQQMRYWKATTTSGVTTYDTPVGDGLFPSVFGTEMVTAVYIVLREINTTTGRGSFRVNPFYQSQQTKSSLYDQGLQIQSFDWHPFTYWLSTISSSSGGPVLTRGMYGDFDNYTIISAENLRKLHNTAVYSLFGVPQI